MNPKAEPFKMKKPIDVANEEIKALKKSIMELRSEITLLKNQMKPLIEDLHKRRAEEEQKDSECVIENNSWWWG
jgi:cell division protein FtsB